MKLTPEPMNTVLSGSDHLLSKNFGNETTLRAKTFQEQTGIETTHSHIGACLALIEEHGPAGRIAVEQWSANDIQKRWRLYRPKRVDTLMKYWDEGRFPLTNDELDTFGRAVRHRLDCNFGNSTSIRPSGLKRVEDLSFDVRRVGKMLAFCEEFDLVRGCQIEKKDAVRNRWILSEKPWYDGPLVSKNN